MKVSAHVVFWVSVWGILFLASPLMLSSEGQVRRIQKEIDSVKVAFGSDKTKAIINDANETYRAYFIETGWLSEENKLYTQQSSKRNEVDDVVSAGAKAMSNVTNGYLHALSVNVYGFLMRWEIFLHWWLFILPFVVAAFIDGYVTRKIKFSQFGYMSPMAYSMSLHIIVFLIFIPLLYLVAPLPISPYFMPGWAVVMGVPINLLVSNTQRLLND